MRLVRLEWPPNADFDRARSMRVSCGVYVCVDAEDRPPDIITDSISKLGQHPEHSAAGPFVIACSSYILRWARSPSRNIQVPLGSKMCQCMIGLLTGVAWSNWGADAEIFHSGYVRMRMNDKHEHGSEGRAVIQ